MNNFDLTSEFFDLSEFVTLDVLKVESILKGETYAYFTNEYQLKVEDVKTVGKWCDKRVVLSSTVGSIERNLCTFTLNKVHWWSRACKSSRNRDGIRSYTKLLASVNGDVRSVMPDYCPVFGNLRLNYTGIDFEGGYNLRRCCEVAGYDDRGETWSPATIDRVDNERGYEYGNIRVISHYANTLKRDSNIMQLQMVIDYIKKNRCIYEI